MSSKAAANYTIRRHLFPIIFGTALVAACIAFQNRYYFLQSTIEEAKNLYKADPEFEAMYEKARADNLEKKSRKQ